MERKTLNTATALKVTLTKIQGQYVDIEIVFQNTKKWLKTSKYPKFSGTFQVLNLRWSVQKLLFLTVPDMIDLENYLKPLIQRQKCPKTSVKVSKKVTNFQKNIRPRQCQPYKSLAKSSERLATRAYDEDNQNTPANHYIS